MASQTGKQMMGYVLQTPQGSLIVVDGGRPQDAEYLTHFIQNLGGNVTAWFITHPHIDHIGALAKIAERQTITIDTIYGSFPDEKWVKKHCRPDRIRDYNYAIGQLKKHHLAVTDLEVGQKLAIDDLDILVLSVKNPEIIVNPINNSSVVLKMADASASILFLGDLGIQGGEKLLKSPMKNFIRADYVQMAHHGQNGVSKEFYRIVDPKYCLWPTPLWLWENNEKGKGYNTGPWKTLLVRQWMKELGVERHFVMADGCQKIR
jgi:beta-lactamase superfamily II metal-dependent hydrolase